MASRQHEVKLSDADKRRWFKDRIEEATRVRHFESEEEIVEFVRSLRKAFKAQFERDVPGSFISRLLSELGFERHHTDAMLKKRRFMFSLMDKNNSFRENKTQLRKAVEEEFGEKILGIVFDEFWDEYHNTERPDAEVDIDIYGQQSLF